MLRLNLKHMEMGTDAGTVNVLPSIPETATYYTAEPEKTDYGKVQMPALPGIKHGTV